MARMKKEDPFYVLLRDFSAKLEETAEDYVKFVDSYPESMSMIPRMRVHEDRCDEMVRKIMKELYTSFITPFDRDDIADLALKMDDVADNMEGVAIGLDLFNMSGTRTEARQMAALTLESVKELRVMFEHLPNYKNDDVVMEKAISVGHIEDEGDSVYENALRRLYHDDSLDEARRGHVVGWMRIFDRMESCLNACDAVAGVVRSVVMKSA